jgi:hypothetical protein
VPKSETPQYIIKLETIGNTMKKHLLVTVPALALGLALSAPAGAIKLKIGGFIDKHVGVSDNDSAYESGAAAAQVSWDVKDDSEILFTASGKLNNGLKVTGRMELEGGTHIGSDPVDETWLKLSGSFGEIILGVHDLAGKRLTAGTQGAFLMGAGPALPYNHGNWISKPSGISTEVTAHVETSGDGDGISYMSPRISGLQFGIGYAAMSTQDSNSVATKAADHEHISGGVNYSTKAGGMSIKVGLGIATAKSGTAAAGDDAMEVGYGIKVSSGPIEVAASMHDKAERATASQTAAATGGDTAEFGIRYTMGSSKIAFVMANSDNNGSHNTAAKDDSSTTYGLSMSRSLGKGATWHATYFYADHDEGTAGAASSSSNTGYALVTGVKIRF